MILYDICSPDEALRAYSPNIHRAQREPCLRQFLMGLRQTGPLEGIKIDLIEKFSDAYDHARHDPVVSPLWLLLTIAFDLSIYFNRFLKPGIQTRALWWICESFESTDWNVSADYLFSSLTYLSTRSYDLPLSAFDSSVRNKRNLSSSHSRSSSQPPSSEGKKVYPSEASTDSLEREGLLSAEVGTEALAEEVMYRPRLRRAANVSRPESMEMSSNRNSAATSSLNSEPRSESNSSHAQDSTETDGSTLESPRRAPIGESVV